jgi:DNA polymerase III subunit delta'
MSITLNFPGNARIRAQLERLMMSGQLGGSYLFEGPRGAGQERAALELAAWRITGSPDPAEEAAGRVLRYVHPDLIYVMPVVPTMAVKDMKDEHWMALFREYQARRGTDPLLPIEFKTNPRVSVKGMRAVRGELAKMPYEGQGRALIIRHADQMDITAQDALLKTLEEPPRNTLIILISHRPDALRETVLSRCQRLVFDPLDESLLRGELESRGLSGERAEFFAALSGGDMEEAVFLAESESEEGNARLDRREAWLDILDTCEFGNEVEMIEAIQAFAKEGAGKEKKNPTQVRVEFMNLALSWYHDLLGMRTRGALRVHRDQDARSQRYSGLDESSLAGRIQKIEKARGQIQGYANVQLTLLALFISLRAAGARK